MQRAIRIIVWSVAAFVFVVLVLRDVQPDGVLDVRTDFKRLTPHVSLLGPPARVDRREGVIALVGEPAYFDLRLPRWFATATVNMTYKSYGSYSTETPRFGVWLDPEHPDRTDAPIALLGTRRLDDHDGWSAVETHLPLRIAPHARTGYRLIISALGTSSSTPLLIHDLTVRAER